MRMDVDEAGRDGEPRRVDLARGGRVTQSAHVDDAPGTDADVRGQPWIAAAVEHTAVTDQDVIASGRLGEGMDREGQKERCKDGKPEAHAPFLPKCGADGDDRAGAGPRSGVV